MLINRSGDVLEANPLTDGIYLGDRDLRGAVFAGITIDSLELSGSDIRDADFSKSNIYWLDCFHANCRDASFRDATLEGANFKSACLRGADFTGARIGSDRLGRASSLAHADLTDAKLLGALLGGTEYDEKTVFPSGFRPSEEGMVLVSVTEDWLLTPWCSDRER
jgi:uncharacterized protein YjbI with pentapeptide repeats